ncbi:MAG: class I SAM-dependent methyltransferase [Halieaceae bacterium]|jgi:ubiquinone/menaquinone biosynthesis C-methylase UbiE|nr:class I SAM-dependent methyltransferase [Halieaceae bacterium]
MRARHLLLSLCLLPVALSCCAASAKEAGTRNPLYRYAEASRDGIGKFYMGREISQVMGHRGAGWLERASREQEERTDLLLSQLPMNKGDTVVDMGAGSGYFSLPMARAVAPGTVMAVDIQPEMLAIIKRRSERAGVDNIATVLATTTDPKIPTGSADLVLLVDAYHEFSHPCEVMAGIYKGLRPGGLVVLVEYRGEDPTVPIKPLHKMTEAQARKELEASGFDFVENRGFLPRQHVLLFRKPG